MFGSNGISGGFGPLEQSLITWLAVRILLGGLAAADEAPASICQSEPLPTSQKVLPVTVTERVIDEPTRSAFRPYMER